MTRLSSILFAGCLAVMLVLAGCQSDNSSNTADDTAAADDTTTEAAPPSETTWGYSGEGAPANWASLSADYEACAGSEQSPIDIVADDEAQSVDVTMDYSESGGLLTGTGKLFKMELDGGSLMLGDKEYELIQFHFHTPSEHTVEGKSYPAEVHLVHAADDGTLAVIGVFYEVGEANEALATFWDKLPTVGNADPVDFNAAELLPSDRTTYTYDGSLTTPPCSEVVSWHVMKTPVSISQEQLDALIEMHGVENNRPVQPLNDREIDTVTL